MPPLTGRVLARHLGALLLGVVVAVVGTGIHRAEQPWGLLLAMLMVVAVGVLARAWIGGSGVLAVALGVMTTVGILGGEGPGGDVLVALQPVGVAWYCSALLTGVAMVLPARWFADVPIGRDRPGERGPADEAP